MTPFAEIHAHWPAVSEMLDAALELPATEPPSRGLWARVVRQLEPQTASGRFPTSRTVDVLRRVSTCTTTFEWHRQPKKESSVGKYLIAWVLGVPAFVLVLFYVFFR